MCFEWHILFLALEVHVKKPISESIFFKIDKILSLLVKVIFTKHLSRGVWISTLRKFAQIAFNLPKMTSALVGKKYLVAMQNVLYFWWRISLVESYNQT